MAVWLRIEPLDVLIFRGNRLFGDPGSLADSLMPPWPSVISGAVRSRMLVDHRVDLQEFARGRKPEGLLGEVLGTPEIPGSFSVGVVGLCKRGQKDSFFPLPLDLQVRVPDEKGALPLVHRLQAVPAPAAAVGQRALPFPNFLLDRSGRREKSRREAYWITSKGLQSYLEGHCPDSKDLVLTRDLWKWDNRLGIGISDERRTAEEGQIYTVEAVALEPGTSFLVELCGCPEDLAPRSGLLRLGGDGRGAVVSLQEKGLSEPPPRSDHPFFLILATPGVFPGGALLPGLQQEEGTFRLKWEKVEARLAASALTRPYVVSGWDLAAHRPRPAQRAVPTGAVYYFDEVKGSPEDPTEQMWKALLKEVPEDQRGLWMQRKAEGFGRLLAGQWNG